MTDKLTFQMTEHLTIKPRAYETSHPWLRFSVDFKRAPPAFWLVLGECQSKCEHISGVPLTPDVAKVLHHVYLAKGAWGTTAIEGNTLSEEEVLKHIHGKLELSPEKDYLKQEIENIIQESNQMLGKVTDHEQLILSPERINEINRIVLNGLSVEEDVEPGVVRRYSVGVMGYRGAPHEDCEYLLARLCDWLNGSDFDPPAGFNGIHMAILKAILAHLYIEWIHAFGDGNGRTGRLVEVQVLMASGIPSPACHLLSNHYNQTRTEYLAQLNRASKSNGDVIPFFTYALNGFLEGLKGQLDYIRKLQMDGAWLNHVHERFKGRNSRAAERQRMLLLDIFEKDGPVPITEIDQVSTGLARAYARVHPRTPMRDVDFLHREGLLIKEGKTVTANRELIASFLPVKSKLS